MLTASKGGVFPLNEVEKWLVRRRQGAGHRLRLFCLPHAGGSASMFASWGQKLPPEVEVCAIQFPGRENRIAEEPIARMDLMAFIIGEIVSNLDGTDFAIFGHSTGAIIGFEVARWLRRNRRANPVKLLVAGSNAPHIADKTPPIHRLPEKEFLAAIHSLEGTPPEVLANSQLVELIMPMLRADIALLETYVHCEEEPLACDIHAFGASDDKVVSLADLQGWSIHTGGRFEMTILEGNHFFVRTSADFMCHLRTALEESVKS